MFNAELYAIGEVLSIVSRDKNRVGQQLTVTYHSMDQDPHRGRLIGSDKAVTVHHTWGRPLASQMYHRQGSTAMGNWDGGRILLGT